MADVKTEVQTELKPDVETENKPANGNQQGDTMASVLRQLDYYFGDYNLPKDKFLKQTIEESEGGWVSLETMLKFQRLAHITTDKAVIIKAAKSSDILEANEEKMEIRRLPSLPIPEFNDDFKKLNLEKTVYCKGFDKEKSTLDDLIKFFQQFEGVMNVIRRTWGKDKERFFKGSVFVTFKDKAAAEKFLGIEEVKSPEGEVLIKMMQQEYFAKKDKESEDKRQARQKVKSDNKKAKEALEEKEAEEFKLPTGAILVLEGFKNAETKREDIKQVLADNHGVNPDSDIAFVYFNKGDQEAKLRFGSENAAKELAKKIADSLKEGEKFTVKDDPLEYKVLEGQEEVDFLEQCKSDIAKHKEKSKRGHKRGGRGGYRGNPKRQRTN